MKKQQIYILALSLFCLSFSTISQSADDSQKSYGIVQAMYACAKFAKEPFYKGIPEVQKACEYVADAVGVEDLHGALKEIPDKKPMANGMLNALYKFIVKTPIDYYASELSKGGIIRGIAKLIIKDYCKKDSLAQWCADQSLNIILSGKISLPVLDIDVLFLNGTTPEVSFDNCVFKHCIESQLSKDTNFWVKKYIKSIYKDSSSWVGKKFKATYPTFVDDVRFVLFDHLTPEYFG